MTRFARLATPLGPMLAIAQDATLVALDFADAKYAPAVDPAWAEDPAWPPLRDCAAQLAEYFAGERSRFDLTLHLAGTEFQRRVWAELVKIPYGETILLISDWQTRACSVAAASCGGPLIARTKLNGSRPPATTLSAASAVDWSFATPDSLNVVIDI